MDMRKYSPSDYENALKKADGDAGRIRFDGTAFFYDGFHFNLNTTHCDVDESRRNEVIEHIFTLRQGFLEDLHSGETSASIMEDMLEDMIEGLKQEPNEMTQHVICAQIWALQDVGEKHGEYVRTLYSIEAGG